jgi:uracil-DNA glycosylase family 4
VRRVAAVVEAAVTRHRHPGLNAVVGVVAVAAGAMPPAATLSAAATVKVPLRFSLFHDSGPCGPESFFCTDAVKWEPKGKRRIHKKPNSREIAACRPWLDAELHVLNPDVVVCLGATAAQSILGKNFRVTERRGEVIASPVAKKVVATVHPSSILRAPDDETRRAEYGRFVEDLKRIAKLLSR